MHIVDIGGENEDVEFGEEELDVARFSPSFLIHSWIPFFFGLSHSWASYNYDPDHFPSLSYCFLSSPLPSAVRFFFLVRSTLCVAASLHSTSLHLAALPFPPACLFDRRKPKSYIKLRPFK